MRIAINALLAGNLSGTGKYITQLVKHLSLIDKQNEYIVINHDDHSFDFLKNHENFKQIEISLKERNRLLWEQTILPLKVKLAKVDILHSPAFIAPYFNLLPSVVTIHDMAFVKHRWTIAKDRCLYYDHFIPRSIKTASKIIAVSEFTRSEIIKCYPNAKPKIRVTKEGIDKILITRPNEQEIISILKKYSLEPGFILSVGTIEPRKNYARLIDAYLKLIKKNNIDLKLVIVGRMGWVYDDVMEIANRPELKEKVIFPGFVSPEDLSAFYSGAKMFVLPSLYEGFGLPLLEAMAMDLPVITSNLSAMPEIAGNAALFVNPYNRREISNAILKLLQDKELSANLSAKSLERAKEFDWNKTAKETIEVYQETLSS